MSRNLLDHETSPYLLLHKDNPVHWRSWSPARSKKPRRRASPSCSRSATRRVTGASIMSAESFGDPDIAAIMNENFINIKSTAKNVPTRSDSIKSAATSTRIIGRLAAHHVPHAAWRAFRCRRLSSRRKTARNRRVQARCCRSVLRVYNEQPEPVANTVARVQTAFAQLWGRDLRGPLDGTRRRRRRRQVRTALRHLLWRHLGQHRNFPTTGLTEMLWRGYLRTGAVQFAQLVQTTLDNMCLGGLYDHVGGGFYRYCIDERWLTPHFEKILYDNALIVDLLTLVSQHNRLPHYRRPHRRHDRLAVPRDDGGRCVRLEPRRRFRRRRRPLLHLDGSRNRRGPDGHVRAALQGRLRRAPRRQFPGPHGSSPFRPSRLSASRCR